jgi:hypothetical protein
MYWLIYIAPLMSSFPAFKRLEGGSLILKEDEIKFY